MLTSREGRAGHRTIAADTTCSFAALLGRLAPLEGATSVLLAVSGGPDSTALMHLVAAWHDAGAARPPIAVASVDHGLRAGSRREAEAVVEAAARLGLPAAVLTWIGEKPGRGRPAAAREARYSLLAHHAHQIGASHLVTAHVLEDQAETLLMRLAAGSGLSGLAGMANGLERDGLVLARPLLGVSKADLLDLCRAEGWAFCEDPTNRDPAYARSRWRAMAPMLAREGLTARRLGLLAARMRRADEALAEAAATLAAAARLSHSGESVHFDARRFARQPDELVIRVLARALGGIGRGRQLRLDRVERLARDVMLALRDGTLLRRTLHGCLVTLDRDGVIAIQPEPPRRHGQKHPLQHDAVFPPAAGLHRPASLGKPTPSSYIDRVDAPARLTEVVEPHSAFVSSMRKPMLCTGPR